MNQVLAVPSSASMPGKWRWLCWALAGLAVVGLIVAPLCSFIAALFPQLLPVLDIRSSIPDTRTVLPAYRILIFLCDLIPTGFGMWVLWSMMCLFLGFIRGEVFTTKALRYLNHVALGLLLSEITHVLILAPETLLATWANGPGHRAVSVSLGSSDIEGLFIAGTAFVIARVMADARAIAAENAEIV
jgi:hypothetical protein